MRKRERDRIIKRLREFHGPLLQQRLGQLERSIWYFDNNAEGKGFSSAYAAVSYFLEHCTKLKKFIEQEHKKSDNRLFKRKKHKKNVRV